MKRISKIYRELKEFHAKGMEPKTRKPQTKSSTKSQLGDISKRADSFKIVRGKRTTASMRNSAGLKRYGEENKQKVITPKMQRRALASPAAKAKPKSQVTLKKAPWDKKNEAFDFKVNIDGFPEMFMSGNSPSEVKAHLRKLVKQPSMIKGVDRVTAHDKKKHHRDKMKESVDLDEGKMKQMHMYMDQGKSAAWIAAKMKLDLKTVKALIGEQNRYQSIKTSIGNFLSRVKNKVMGNKPTGTASRANLRAKGVNL